MLCNELMKRELETLKPRDDVRAAARKMRDANVGFLPVVDEHRKVHGVLTDRDIALRCVAEDVSPDTRVSDLMTHQVVACRANEDIRKAEELMARHQKSRVLCLDDDGRLVGVISLSDIAQVEEADRVRVTVRQVTSREAEA